MGFANLTRRNIQLYFKDKALFFTSLITPVILLVLYMTFLANVYKDSFASAIPEGVTVADKLLNATVGGQLFTSLLAVSCITVAFCCNTMMVQDKISGGIKDITVSPVKNSVVAAGYYVATLVSTIIICFVACGACFIYLANSGWYMNGNDVITILATVLLMCMFGTSLSCVLNGLTKTQGQASAIGTIISAGYGFICGAYMPIYSFSAGLRNVLMYLPGTYGTSLIRNIVLRGVFEEMGNVGFPEDVVEKIKDSIDCNIYFNGTKVTLPAMYIVVGVSTILFILLFIIINRLNSVKHKK